MDITSGTCLHPGEYSRGVQASQMFPGEPTMTDEDEQSQMESVALMKNESQSHQKYVKHEWRPLYLQRQVLLSCCLLCISLIIAVELLSWYSTKHNGLTESNTHIHYLWTYGPTVILTVIGTIWTRIDYQAKLTAPWNHLAHGPAVAKITLLLDYIDPLPPVSVISAMRNGDFGVAAAATIALLWSLVIAFSASLISLTPIDSDETTVSVYLTTSFKNDPTALDGSRSLSYYNMLGLQQANLSFPDGISEGYAYQTFTARDIPPTTELHVTVDGVSAGLVCEEASYHVYLASWIDTGYPYLNFTMESDNCQMKSAWFGPTLDSEGSDIYYSRFGTGSCQSSTSKDDQRIAITFGSIRLNGPVASNSGGIAVPGSPLNVSITESASLICRPAYVVDKVTIIKNGSDILSLTTSSSAEPMKLGNIHAWDITRALMQSLYNPLTDNYVNEDGVLLISQTFNASDKPVDVDRNMYLVLGQRYTEPPSIATLLNTSFLQDLTATYYRTYAAFIINDLIIEPSLTESTAQAVLYQQRLLVNATAAYTMTGILGASVLLLVVVIIITPNFSVLPCAPSSISGVAKLASHSQAVYQRLSGLGRSNTQTIATTLEGYSYMTSMQDGDASHQGYFEVTGTNISAEEPNTRVENSSLRNPVILQAWSRAGISILTLGIIAALEATLQVSQRNNGIGAVPVGSRYLHYSWTTVPALILTAVSLFYGAIDANIRRLTPYVNLSHGSPSVHSIGLDLSDIGVPRMLVREFRTRSFAALGTTLAALIASLLATISSSLFVLSNVPIEATAQLRTTSSINNDSSMDYGSTILSRLTAPLILESNLTYPKFTHETLVFPILSLDLSGSMGSDILLNATIPAIRPKMECRLHDSHTIVAGFSESKELQINVTEGSCISTGVLQLVDRWIGRGPELGTVTTEGVMAGVTAGWCDVSERGSDWVYFWTDIKLDPDPIFTSISVLICNESLEAVDVFTSFIGADLKFNPDHAPAPNEETVRKTTAVIGADNGPLYADLQSGPSDSMDNFFSLLLTSRYAIPLAYFSDASKAGDVRDAIVFQHGIIRSQKMHDARRAVPEKTNALTLGRGTEPDKSDAVVYPATVTPGVGEIHIVQDATSTRVLQALLVVMLVCSLGAWVIMPRTKILTHAPTSMASVLALLADGNVFELLPAGCQTSEEKDIERLFSDLTFQMGWVGSIGTGNEKAKFTIYGLQNKL